MNVFYKSRYKRRRPSSYFHSPGAQSELYNNIVDTVNKSYAIQQEHNNALYKMELSKLEKQLLALTKQNEAIRSSQKAQQERQWLKNQMEVDHQNHTMNVSSNENNMDDDDDDGDDNENNSDDNDNDVVEDEPEYKSYTFPKMDKKNKKRTIQQISKGCNDGTKTKQKDLSKEFNKISQNKRNAASKTKKRKVTNGNKR